MKPASKYRGLSIATSLEGCPPDLSGEPKKVLKVIGLNPNGITKDEVTIF